MSTLVMVQRGGEACMAAETLTSFGSRKQAARYVASPEKIIRVGDALGAMFAGYELGLPAEEIARIGVEAGIEFDDASLGPITLKTVKLEA